MEQTKTILLIRHAKSSWKDITLDDFDRPLNKRGKGDAPLMAHYLKNKNIPIDKIFSSSAKRAKKTAEVFSKELNVSLELYDELYLASSEQLLLFIKNKLMKYDSIAIVAHNPGVTELSNYLSDTYLENIPTAAYVILECYDDKIDKESFKLIDFMYPKREDSSLH